MYSQTSPLLEKNQKNISRIARAFDDNRTLSNQKGTQKREGFSPFFSARPDVRASGKTERNAHFFFSLAAERDDAPREEERDVHPRQVAKRRGRRSLRVQQRGWLWTSTRRGGAATTARGARDRGVYADSRTDVAEKLRPRAREDGHATARDAEERLRRRGELWDTIQRDLSGGVLSGEETLEPGHVLRDPLDAADDGE